MEITNKRKGWTLAAFVAGVSIPAAIIGHTVSNGLKATYVTEEHKELVVANAVESHSDHFHIDYNAHKDNTLVLSVDFVLSRWNDGSLTNGNAPLVLSDDGDYTGYELAAEAGDEVNIIAEVGYDNAVKAGLAVGAIYNAASDINAATAVEAVGGADDLLSSLSQVRVTEIVGSDTDSDGKDDNFVISYSKAVGFVSGAVVTASFTLSPAEGYTFVRQNPDADNSHAGKDIFDQAPVLISFA